MPRLNLTTAVYGALLAYLVSFLAGRVRVLSLGYFNAPVRMPTYAAFASHEIKFASQTRSCEDVVLVESASLALLVCDPGRETWNTVMGLFTAPEPEPNASLFAYKYTDTETDALTPIELLNFTAELRTLGLEFHEPTSTLFITNHGRQGPSIEVFHLDLETLQATHKHTLTHPLLRSPNSITALSATDILVTNQHYFTARDSPRILWLLETYLALPLGTIVHARIRADGTLDAERIAHQAYPNGMALLNETTLAVASTNKRLVYLYALDADHRIERTVGSIWLPFLPDNLSVEKDTGALLIAGHPHLPSLNKFASSRQVCNRQPGEGDKEMCEGLGAGSWVSEWTAEGGLRHLYAGWEYPSSTTVVRDRGKGVGIVTGLYAKGVMVWRD